jgi:multiple sugar transport system permease protein
MASVGLSFTSWDGIGGLGTIKWVPPPDSRSTRRSGRRCATTSSGWCSSLVPTTFGIFLAVLLDKEIRFTRI